MFVAINPLFVLINTGMQLVGVSFFETFTSHPFIIDVTSRDALLALPGLENRPTAYTDLIEIVEATLERRLPRYLSKQTNYVELGNLIKILMAFKSIEIIMRED